MFELISAIETLITTMVFGRLVKMLDKVKPYFDVHLSEYGSVVGGEVAEWSKAPAC